jgi:hypothetical protein
MFPHLIQRLFVGKDSKTIRAGLSFMNVRLVECGLASLARFECLESQRFVVQSP